MARAVEQVTTTRGVQVEEDTGHNDDLLLETGLEEVEAVGDGLGETLEVEPQVEGAVGHVLDDKAHVAQALDNVVSLVLLMGLSSSVLLVRNLRVGWTYTEVALQSDHLLLYEAGLKHGNGRLLEGSVGTAVKVRTARADTVACIST